MPGNAGGLYGELGIDVSQAQAALESANKLIRATQLNLGQLVNATREVGTSSVDAAGNIDKTTAALDKQGKAVSAATAFYREHRQEHRQISFYSRNSQEAIFGTMLAFQALSGSISDSSESMKAIKNAVMEGSQSFMGFNFMLSALGVGGPMALAIAGVGALTIVLSKLGGQTDEDKKKFEELLASIVKVKIERGELVKTGVTPPMGVITPEQNLMMQQQQLEEAKTALAALVTPKPVYHEPVVYQKGGVVEPGYTTVGQKGTPTQIAEQQKKIEDLQKAITKLQQEIEDKKDLGTAAPAAEEVPLGAPGSARDLNTEIQKRQTLLVLLKQESPEWNRLTAEIKKYQDQLNAPEAKAREAERLAKANEKLTSMTSESGIGLMDEGLAKQLAYEQRNYEQKKRDILAAGASQKQTDDALAANEELHAKAVADIRKKNQEELARQEQELSQQQLEAVSALASALESAFSRGGNTLLSKLGQALQIAISIAKAMSLAKAPGADPTSGTLGILSSILGIAGLFAEGGYTGPGSRQQPAGVVHKGEYVFEKPLVDQYGGALASIRHAMQHGISMSNYAVGGLVGITGSGGGGGGYMHVVGKVDISNGQLMLRREFGELDRFNKKKILDK